MPNIYLRHPTHGAKIAISWNEAQEDMAHGWEEFDPSVPDEPESPASVEILTPEFSDAVLPEPAAGNALRRRRRKE